MVSVTRDCVKNCGVLIWHYQKLLKNAKCGNRKKKLKHFTCKREKVQKSVWHSVAEIGLEIHLQRRAIGAVEDSRRKSSFTASIIHPVETLLLFREIIFLAVQIHIGVLREGVRQEIQTDVDDVDLPMQQAGVQLLEKFVMFAIDIVTLLGFVMQKMYITLEMMDVHIAVIHMNRNLLIRQKNTIIM